MNGRTFYIVYARANYFTVIVPCTATKATVLTSNYISLLAFNTLMISNVPKLKFYHKL